MAAFLDHLKNVVMSVTKLISRSSVGVEITGSAMTGREHTDGGLLPTGAALSYASSTLRLFPRARAALSRV